MFDIFIYELGMYFDLRQYTKLLPLAENGEKVTTYIGLENLGIGKFMYWLAKLPKYKIMY
jgi:hypothetical protein